MEDSAATFSQHHIPSIAGKETFRKVKITGLFYFSPLMWKVYRNMTFPNDPFRLIGMVSVTFNISKHFVVKLKAPGTC